MSAALGGDSTIQLSSDNGQGGEVKQRGAVEKGLARGVRRQRQVVNVVVTPVSPLPQFVSWLK